MPSDSPRPLSDSWLLAAFALLAAGIGALWYSAVSAYEAAVLRERGRELAAITELKIGLVGFWLEERRGDAMVQAGRLMLANSLAPRPGSAGSYSPEDVQGQLEAVRRAYDYKAVTLFDRDGAIRLGAGPLSDFGRSATTAAARTAMANGEVTVSLTSHLLEDGTPHADIDVAAPVADRRQPGASVLGALAFHLDSRRHLDPLLRGWPAPAGSGEAFLVQRTNGEIAYLSSLRHADAQTLRRKTDEPSLPAAHAARGEQGVSEGIDYRGVPVLAAVGRVPGMPWFVVAKLDRAEILAPVRRQALWSGALSALLVLALGLAMLAWRQRSASELALASQVAARQALRESEERYRALFELSPDAIFVHRDDILVFANAAAARLFGAAAPQDLVGRDWHELVAAEEWPAIEARIAALAGGECASLPPQERHYLTQGSEVVVAESSAARILFDGAPAVLSITRDISERKLAEELRLQQCRDQRDALVREVHHRIKNHLQGLTGLLGQHRGGPLSPDLLEAVIAQISAISVVHGLQGRTAGEAVRPVMLLKEIVAYLGARAPLAFANAGDAACRDCPFHVANEECVPVALIVNELVTNAIKHRGGPEDAPVRLTCACDEEQIAVTLRHPGSLPPGFDFAAGRGLGTGLALVRSLLPREGAALTIAADAGAVETRLGLKAPAVLRDQLDSRR